MKKGQAEILLLVGLLVAVSVGFFVFKPQAPQTSFQAFEFSVLPPVSVPTAIDFSSKWSASQGQNGVFYDFFFDPVYSGSKSQTNSKTIVPLVFHSSCTDPVGGNLTNCWMSPDFPNLFFGIASNGQIFYRAQPNSTAQLMMSWWVDADGNYTVSENFNAPESTKYPYGVQMWVRRSSAQNVFGSIAAPYNSTSSSCGLNIVTSSTPLFQCPIAGVKAGEFIRIVVDAHVGSPYSYGYIPLAKISRGLPPFDGSQYVSTPTPLAATPTAMPSPVSTPLPSPSPTVLAPTPTPFVESPTSTPIPTPEATTEVIMPESQVQQPVSTSITTSVSEEATAAPEISIAPPLPMPMPPQQSQDVTPYAVGLVLAAIGAVLFIKAKG